MRPKASLTRAEIHAAAPILAALGEETRLRLLAQLASEGPSSTSHLSAKAQGSRQAVTKHLELLAETGLLVSERNGRERIWALDSKRITYARKLLKQLSLAWEDTSARLRVQEPA